MTAPLFVDTNVLIYAYDVRACDRHAVAKTLVADLWRLGRGTLSTQVLQEFYVNATRKIPVPLSRAEARRVIRQYCVWPVVTVVPADVVDASEVEERHQISFWDALIVVAARRSGASVLVSEDLGAGQTVAGIRVVNPFADPAEVAALLRA